SETCWTRTSDPLVKSLEVRCPRLQSDAKQTNKNAALQCILNNTLSRFANRRQPLQSGYVAAMLSRQLNSTRVFDFRGGDGEETNRDAAQR
ncbi:MAG: hypothetical protein MSG64_19800, partial [Pyrinomonadaceae bacterium MAG19_C2-C3]|nr:hypothetical protein [Pyrinomonadaceae bacterium MAG19_C2-C3]